MISSYLSANSLSYKILMILIMGFGLYLLIQGIFEMKNEQIFNKNYVKTKATLVDYGGFDYHGLEMYNPVYEYNVDNKKYNVKHGITSNVTSKLGDKLTIRYNIINNNPVYFGCAESGFAGFAVGLLLIAICSSKLVANNKKLSKIINPIIAFILGISGILIYCYVAVTSFTWNPYTLLINNFSYVLFSCIFIYIFIMEIYNMFKNKNRDE